MGKPLHGSDLTRPTSQVHRLWSVAAIIGLAFMGMWALNSVGARQSPDTAPAPSSAAATTPALPSSPARQTTPANLSTAAPAVSFETAMPPFGGVVLGGEARGSANTGRDLLASSDAWTVVVRRHDGSLGRHGAVVTFPVKAASGQNLDTVRVGAVTGVALPGHIVWPLAGQHARVRGDLSTAVLAQIAAATVVIDGRPQVAPPAGFRVISRSPLRMPLVHQVFYDGGQLGLTFTSLARSGGFEEALYATKVTPAGEVHGAPAVASDAGSGTGTVAWEPSPGLVAYVGWSGEPLSQSSTFTAVRLAQESRILSPREWLALKPSLADQPANIPPS